MIVKDIFNLYGGFRGCKLLTNKNTLNNVVENVTLMEVPEGIFWASKNYFLITTGYFIKESNLNLIDVIRTLINLGSSGLGIKLGSFLKSYPYEAIEYANKYNFAIIDMPVEMSYNEMTLPIVEYAHKKNNYLNSQVLEISKKIKGIMYKNGNLNDLLNLFKYTFNYEVEYYIFGYNNHHINLDLKNAIDFYYSNNNFNTYKYFEFNDKLELNTNDGTYKIIPIINFDNISCIICIDNIYDIKESDLKVLSLLNDSLVIFNNYILRYHSNNSLTLENFYENILNGYYVNDDFKLEKDADLFKLRNNISNTIFNIRFYTDLQYNINSILKTVKFEIKKLKINFYIKQNENSITIILCDEKKEKNNKKFFSNLACRIKNIFENEYGFKKIYIGISQKCNSLKHLLNAYNESIFASLIAEKIDEKNIAFYEDYIIYDLMYNIRNTKTVINLERITFKRLESYDKKNKSQLTKTLIEYIDSDFSIVVSAEKLFIHKNTMYNRIDKISEILDMDLNDNNNKFIVLLIRNIRKISSK